MIRKSDAQLISQQNWKFDYTRCPIEDLYRNLGTSDRGLTEQEAAARLIDYGSNAPARKKKHTVIFQFLANFANPLVVVLLAIGGFSFFFGEKISAALVAAMALVSVVLSFIQEFRAGREAEKLSEMVHATTAVIRGGKTREVKIPEIVPGDIIDLFAGDIIPADLRIISCKDLFINQSSLTGESLPVEKFAAPGADPSAASNPPNVVYMGSSVVSGSALGVVVKTGLATKFGEISRRLILHHVDTDFDRGIRSFTWFMIGTMLIMAGIIFLINLISKGNVIEAFLFALAVAVGLTPEMLPMLVTINLSKGAIAMSQKQVIVKRLNSIQNFGAMNILCTDKTGTLTKDHIVLERHCDVIRREDQTVLELAYINSKYQTGLKNLLDRAVLKYERMPTTQYKKVDEIPFDFARRLMTVVVENEGNHKLIAKGAPEEVFKRCVKYELDGELFDLDNLILTDLKEEYDKLSSDGFRVIAVGYKDMENPKSVYSKEDERDLILKGYLAFLDPPKTSARHAIELLHRRGIEFKILTGDNELVTQKICSDVGLSVKGLMTGEGLDNIPDAELSALAETTNVFARLSPLQKERVIRLLRARGHVVGYLGDGINDAPALKAADVGISVNNATDIAKESADIILLKKSLSVLEDGVVEGRKTFANIIKYIRMGASSNFGNMFSMTGASLFLPFLPMLPIQILLNNFLYDISQLAIPTDRVDRDYLLKPKRWDIRSLARFMVFFGPISSIFDFLTFWVLYHVYKATPSFFHTGWFLESLITQTLIIHVIRTEKIPFLESASSPFLMIMSVSIIGIGLIIPFGPLAAAFGFVEPPSSYLVVLFFMVLGYLTATQTAKQVYSSLYGFD